MGYHLSHLGSYRGQNLEVLRLGGVCPLYVAVDILTHHDGIRHSDLEGQSSTTTRELLVLIACMLQ
jgi:hypothetical protein